jgi:DNA polymerase-1
MREIAIDFETFLICPGQLAPYPVCLTRHDPAVGPPQVIPVCEGALDVLRADLADPTCYLYAHNSAFDLAVAAAAGIPIELVWGALRAGRIRDTQVAARLAALAAGEYAFNPRLRIKDPTFSLAEVLRDRFGVMLDKGAVRLNFGARHGAPLSEYSPEEIAYCVGDVEYLIPLWQQLGEPADVYRQTVTAFACYLTAARGLRTDRAQIDRVEEALRVAVAQHWQALQEAGIYRADGTQDKKAVYARVEAAYTAQGRVVPRTEKQAVAHDRGEPAGTSTDEETLRGSNDPVLGRLADIGGAQKLLTTYVPLLRTGQTWPIHCRYAMAQSGRQIASGPNVQNQPRAPGVRECFVPRRGFWFLNIDLKAAELVAFAQIQIDLFHTSRMADEINAGKDLHVLTGSQIAGISYDEGWKLHKAKDPRFKDLRQLAKALNFGTPGGLGAPAFSEFAAAQYDVIVTHEEARRHLAHWREIWPEAALYLREIGRRIETGYTRHTQHRSGRVRYEDKYTAACNTFFQGGTADLLLEAAGRIIEEATTDPTSPLWGCYMVALIHDEIMLEVPAQLARARAAERRASQRLLETARVWSPDVRSDVESTISTVWSKGAQELRDASGGLLPWSP